MTLPDYLSRHKLAAPVLMPTRRQGAYDSQAVECPNIVRHDGRWWMLYTAFNGTTESLALAVSDDLLSWQRIQQILAPHPQHAWEAGGVSGPGTVVRADGRWAMLYVGY